MAEKYELAYRDYKDGMKQKEIAAKYDVSINTVKSWQQRKWKRMDADASESEKVCTPNNESMHTKKDEGTHTKSSAAEHEQNVDEALIDVEYEEPPRKDGRVKRRSGNPNPKNQFTKRNNAAVTHGFYSKYLPDEARAIFDAIDVMSTADMLWDQIKIMYTNIMRAQSIMFVESKEEMIKELKKHKENEHGEEVEYEFQFAWERQAQVLNAQARAMSELRSLINQFIKAADEADERRLKLEQIQVGIDKARAEINKLQEPEKDKAIQINLVKRGGKNDSGD